MNLRISPLLPLEESAKGRRGSANDEAPRCMTKAIYLKPLLILLLVIQCGFLVFTLFAAPDANGYLNGAISNLRNASQSNIARLDQNEARATTLILERLATSQKSNTLITLLFNFVNIGLMAVLAMPPPFLRAPETTERIRAALAD